MTLSAEFHTLTYTPDLTQAGLAYAGWQLTAGLDSSMPSYEDLRQIVAETAADLVWRRLLITEKIPHRLLPAAPLTNPYRQETILGERRVRMATALVTNRPAGELEKAQALVAASAPDDPQHSPADIYVFAFLIGRVTPNREAVTAAHAAGEPLYLLHALPEAWARPEGWSSLGQLTLKSEEPRPLALALRGLDRTRNFIETPHILPPSQEVHVTQEYYNLSYLQTATPPTARVAIRSQALNELHLAAPYQWGNLWVYGDKIVLAGYLPWSEFANHAQPLPAGVRVWHTPRLARSSLAVPVTALRPLDDLFDRAREWAGGLG